jgi:hypothetical protein
VEVAFTITDEYRDMSMDRAIAERLIEAALSFDEGIGRLDAIVSDMEDGKEKKELVKALGEILRVVTKDFVFRVTHQYPDLDPDREWRPPGDDRGPRPC